MIDTALLNAQINLHDLISRNTRLTGGPKEFSGPCPKCGGTDRFHVKLGAGWFCRACTGDPTVSRWHDAIDYIQFIAGVSFVEAVARLGGGRTIDPAERQRLSAESAARDAVRRAEDAAKLADKRKRLNQGGRWRGYNALMPDEGRALWRKRGIPDQWQDALYLGYDPAHEFMHDERMFTTPTLTIPYIRPRLTQTPNGAQLTPECVGLVHRLLMTNPPGGKYRPEMAGLGKPLYWPDPFATALMPDVILVEGEIKAAVLHVAIQEYQIAYRDYTLAGVSVVGAAGKNFKPEWLDDLTTCRSVCIIPDPDALREAEQAAAAIGAWRCWIAEPINKIDDMLTGGEIDIAGLIAHLWTARRA